MRIAIVGGGAAGFFGAITCAKANPRNEIVIFERSSQPLQKVRISGGGRCNVTHAMFEPREVTTRYPRGGRELIASFHRFGTAETVAWFEHRGVRLKTEADGRMFPMTDSSDTVVDCLIREAQRAGVKLFTRRGAESVERAGDSFLLRLTDDESFTCDRLLLATGGARNQTGAKLAQALGHAIEPPVPSLFSFESEAGWMRHLAGISVADAQLSIADARLVERGPVLITHRGVSGPAVLRLSAWGARELHERGYQFTLRLNWLPAMTTEEITAEFQTQRAAHPNRLVVNSALAGVPARLWEQLALRSGILAETRWTSLRHAAANALMGLLTRTEIAIDGKSLNKDEFVTCGGVRLREVDFKTMESRITRGLYFGGELLDIDGITGGFNFQSAWTTGWMAGNAMARAGAPRTI
ncbi:MAG: NAD(P)/FAD-dependent oxidoreductase [Chthoniobacterales bacterium]